jgi:inosine triphosphate pyrophosphatase
MLVGFEDKTAYAECIISYMEPGFEEPLLFVGRCPGKIV